MEAQNTVPQPRLKKFFTNDKTRIFYVQVKINKVKDAKGGICVSDNVFRDGYNRLAHSSRKCFVRLAVLFFHRKCKSAYILHLMLEQSRRARVRGKNC